MSTNWNQLVPKQWCLVNFEHLWYLVQSSNSWTPSSTKTLSFWGLPWVAASLRYLRRSPKCVFFYCHSNSIPTVLVHRYYSGSSCGLLGEFRIYIFFPGSFFQSQNLSKPISSHWVQSVSCEYHFPKVFWPWFFCVVEILNPGEKTLFDLTVVWPRLLKSKPLFVQLRSVHAKFATLIRLLI